LELHGVAREVADRLGVQAIHLSLTHTSDQAMAWVLLEG
jgi:phosphopantetheinyl transferase (holo-ACP synthase)